MVTCRAGGERGRRVTIVIVIVVHRSGKRGGGESRRGSG